MRGSFDIDDKRLWIVPQPFPGQLGFVWKRRVTRVFLDFLDVYMVHQEPFLEGQD